MENEENFNWLEIYMDIQEGKDIKNSRAFQLLNSNNIDTNELTRHEKDKDAGVVKLNYKDEKEKETDSISFSKGLLSFVADMPEETVKALMMAFLNGTDVAANAAGVVFNAMTNSDPAVAMAFQEGNPEKFKKLVNKNIQDFSKYLSEQKKEVKEIGEGSELNSKAAQFVSMVTQDTPYSLPIYKKLTSLGMPKYMALPVAYGIGSGVAFDDDAQIFLNSEQVQSFKEMVGALPNSSEEKIFNTTYRTLEGTALGFAIPYVFNGLKFAKNTIPKYMKPQTTIATGSAASVGAVVDNATANDVVKNDTPVTNQDMQDTITKAEKADDQLMFFDGEKESGPDDPINDYIKITDPKALEGADIVFYDDETMEQMTYQKINETDDDWIILNQDRKTSYNQ